MNRIYAWAAGRSPLQKVTTGAEARSLLRDSVKMALANASRRQLTGEFSLALAILAAVSIGDLYIALAITFFAVLSMIVREKAIAHGRRSFHYAVQERFPPIAVGAAEQALQVRAPVQRTADWLLAFLVCLSAGAAVFTIVSTKNVRAAIAVIIVGGGCGLASGTSLVILGAIGRAARRGALIMATGSLEELANVDVAVLDETAVRTFRSAGTFNVRSDGKSLANTRQAVRRLSKMNIETILFTDELEPVGKVIGDKLGINLVEAELFPEDKACKIAALQRRGRRVAMLTNGVNAGPALVEADVVVVIGSAAGVAEDLADAILPGDILCDFVEAVAIARRAKRIVNFNFLVTTLAASVGVGLAMGGQLNAVWALVIRFTSELIAVLNAMRLVPISPRIDAEKSVDSSLVWREKRAASR